MTFFGLMINLEKLDLARCTKIHDGLVHLNGVAWKLVKLRQHYSYQKQISCKATTRQLTTYFELVSTYVTCSIGACMELQWTVDVNDCGDLVLESQLLKEGVRALNRKSRSKHLGLKQWTGHAATT
ncbi:hypothetical protein WN944_029203 [Citrus x changshan-huyou]|uniref:Uncharacterized protein n=1 Tax=Citrus x changshan-huyou TaxID=2935761 RepID=A0AAP0QBI2_9ROSI